MGRCGFESEALAGKIVETTPVEDRARRRRASTVDSYRVGILNLESRSCSRGSRRLDCARVVGAPSVAGRRSSRSDRRLFGSHMARSEFVSGVKEQEGVTQRLLRLLLLNITSCSFHSSSIPYAVNDLSDRPRRSQVLGGSLPVKLVVT